MSLLTLFIITSVVNVILSTIKTIVTVKSNKYIASIISAINQGFNVYIVVLTMCELPIWEKSLIVALCYLFGVFIVKLVEEKARKDKLWRIDFTILSEHVQDADTRLDSFNIPHNYIENIGKHTLFTCYCSTKDETRFVKELMGDYHAKYFVTEGVQ